MTQDDLTDKVAEYPESFTVKQKINPNVVAYEVAKVARFAEDDEKLGPPVSRSEAMTDKKKSERVYREFIDTIIQEITTQTVRTTLKLSSLRDLLGWYDSLLSEGLTNAIQQLNTVTNTLTDTQGRLLK